MAEFADISRIFGKKGWERIRLCLEQLPGQTRYTTELLLEQLDTVEGHIKAIEKKVLDKVAAIRVYFRL